MPLIQSHSSGSKLTAGKMQSDSAIWEAAGRACSKISEIMKSNGRPGMTWKPQRKMHYHATTTRKLATTSSRLCLFAESSDLIVLLMPSNASSSSEWRMTSMLSHLPLFTRRFSNSLQRRPQLYSFCHQVLTLKLKYRNLSKKLVSAWVNSTSWPSVRAWRKPQRHTLNVARSEVTG